MAPAVDIGTLLLLNREVNLFTGDLDIDFQNGGASSLIGIPFGGPIDINSFLVTSFTFTIMELYHNGNLLSHCDEKMEWREIRVFREREVTLLNSFTIDKGHPSNVVTGDISQLTGPTLVTHSNNEVQILGNSSNPASVKIEFASPLSISQISIAQKEDINTAYKIELFAGTSISGSPDETFLYEPSYREMIDIVVTTPVVQTVMIYLDLTGLLTLKMRKVLIFERLAMC